MVANSRVFYPLMATMEVHNLETRVASLKRALREIEALNPHPAIAAIIEDAIALDKELRMK